MSQLMQYKPSFKSFIGSSLYRLSPLLIAGFVTYFLRGSGHRWLWVLGGVMGLFSLYLVIEAVFVHCQTLQLDDYGIQVFGPLVKKRIMWSEVVNATLRERVNAVSRTDRALVIQSRDDLLIFNTSTLSPAQEDEALQKIRSKASLVVQQDRPSI